MAISKLESFKDWIGQNNFTQKLYSYHYFLVPEDLSYRLKGLQAVLL